MNEKTKIILIDNIAYNRISLKKLLEKDEQFQIEEAATGIEGILKSKLFLPDIIIIGLAILKVESDYVIANLLQIRPDAKIGIFTLQEIDSTFMEKIVNLGVLKVIKKTTDDEVKQSILKLKEMEVIRKPLPQKKVEALKHDDLDSKFVQPVVISVMDVLKKVLGGEITLGNLFCLEIAFTTMGIGASIDFLGDFEGKIFLDMTLKTASLITKKMFNEEVNEINEITKSAVGEITNTIAGGIASRLASYGKVKISIPKVISENIFPDHINRKVLIVPFGLKNELFTVNFFLKEIDKHLK